MKPINFVLVFLTILLAACNEEPMVSTDCDPQQVIVGLDKGKPIYIEDNWLREIRYQDSLIVVKQYSKTNSSLCRSSYYYYTNNQCYLVKDTVICGPDISHVASYKITRSQDTLWKRGRLFSFDASRLALDSINAFYNIDSMHRVVGSGVKKESNFYQLQDYYEYRYSENIPNDGFLYADWKWLGIESPNLPTAVLFGDQEPYGEWYSFEYQQHSSGLVRERRMYKGFEPELVNLVQCQKFSYF